VREGQIPHPEERRVRHPRAKQKQIPHFVRDDKDLEGRAFLCSPFGVLGVGGVCV
jgi:hypothetical protein